MRANDWGWHINLKGNEFANNASVAWTINLTTRHNLLADYFPVCDWKVEAMVKNTKTSSTLYRPAADAEWSRKNFHFPIAVLQAAMTKWDWTPTCFNEYRDGTPMLFAHFTVNSTRSVVKSSTTTKLIETLEQTGHRSTAAPVQAKTGSKMKMQVCELLGVPASLSQQRKAWVTIHAKANPMFDYYIERIQEFMEQIRHLKSLRLIPHPHYQEWIDEYRTNLYPAYQKAA